MRAEPPVAQVFEPDYEQGEGYSSCSGGFCNTGFCRRPLSGSHRRGSAVVGRNGYEPLPTSEDYIGESAAERSPAPLPAEPGRGRCSSFCHTFCITVLVAGAGGFVAGKLASSEKGAGEIAKAFDFAGWGLADNSLVWASDEDSNLSNSTFDGEEPFFLSDGNESAGDEEGSLSASSNLSNSTFDGEEPFFLSDGNESVLATRGGHSLPASEPGSFTAFRADEADNASVNGSELEETTRSSAAQNNGTDSGDPPSGANASESAGDSASSERLRAATDLSYCQFNPACTHLDGLCCPSVSGHNLSCCSEEASTTTAQSEEFPFTSSEASTQTSARTSSSATSTSGPSRRGSPSEGAASAGSSSTARSTTSVPEKSTSTSRSRSAESEETTSGEQASLLG